MSAFQDENQQWLFNSPQNFSSSVNSKLSDDACNHSLSEKGDTSEEKSETRMPLIYDLDSSTITPSDDISEVCINEIDAEVSLQSPDLGSPIDVQSLMEETAESAETVEETAEQIAAREEAESIRLAYELMQQENLEAYRMQMQFMQENAESLSSEDYAALQQIVNENAHYEMHTQYGAANQQQELRGEEEEEGDEEDVTDPENWDYDRLIALGQEIGDVKTERWRLRASSVISTLKTLTYDEIIAAHKKGDATKGTDDCSTSSIITTSDGDVVDNSVLLATPATKGSGDLTSNALPNLEIGCAICMEGFACADKLTLLPCNHYFHTECTSGWLADHNSCPMCKRKITLSP